MADMNTGDDDLENYFKNPTYMLYEDTSTTQLPVPSPSGPLERENTPGTTYDTVNLSFQNQQRMDKHTLYLTEDKQMVHVNTLHYK